jgi:hypothetical protein
MEQLNSQRHSQDNKDRNDGKNTGDDKRLDFEESLNDDKNINALRWSGLCSLWFAIGCAAGERLPWTPFEAFVLFHLERVKDLAPAQAGLI